MPIIDPRHRRSYLFVPANRPERLPKALAAGADAVILDLEDAVPPQDKEAARGILGRLPDAAPGGPALLVRVNALRSATGLADLLAAVAALRSAAPLAGFVLPKAEPRDVRLCADVLDDAGLPGEIGALIESCAGLDAARDTARAAPGRLSFLMFGGADLSAELGVSLAWEPLLHARSQIVQAAAGAGLAAVDVPWIALDDPAGEAADNARGAALGFTARAAIHPRQIAGIHSALAPAEAELSGARRLLAAYDEAAGRACLLDGRLVERPTAERARRLLARAAAAA